MSDEELKEAYNKHCQHMKELEDIFGPMSDLPEEVEKEANKRFKEKCIPLGINVMDL